MRNYRWLRLMIGTGIWVGVSPWAQGVQLSDGKVYFVQPPALLSVRTTFNDTYVWGATYYFTLNLPENAGEPLEQVKINQYQGGDNIEFYLKSTEAFVQIPGKKEQKLKLGSVSRDEKTRTVSVVFDPPVSPGTKVKIGLYPVHNPQFDGIYLFGVTAFPMGENPYGQFLGYGRLQFYHEPHFHIR